MCDMMASTGTSNRIAVAIACYNQGHFVDDAIRSVLAQTRSSDEIILVDDGSTDSTAEIVRSFPRVRYHYQKNAGLSAARNVALSMTESKWILFLDADDLLNPTALHEAERCIAKSAELAFAYGGYVVVDNNRRSLGSHQAQPTTTPFLDLLRGNFIAMHGTVLYDSRLLRESGGFDVDLRSCEDYDVYLRLARHHPIAAYDCIAAEYRRHQQGLSNNSLRMISTSRTVIRRHSRSAPPDDRHRAAARAGCSFMTTYYAQNLIDVIQQARRERRLGEFSKLLARDASSYPLAMTLVMKLCFFKSLRSILRRLRQR